MKSANRAKSTPVLEGILETAVYADDLEAAERFYSSVLGLPKIFTVPGRQLVFRCQSSILLVFNPGHTESERIVINGGDIPLHGARGSGHMAFQIPKTSLDAWRKHLKRMDVKIESEVAWPGGAHSLYFRDPAGNSLELATPDMWKSPPLLTQ